MSGPYVSFRVNRASKAILTDTIRFEPDPMPEVTNPFEWQIVCDSADKVVIRALEDGKRTLAVIAVAELRGLTLVGRQQIDPMMPTPALWDWLETIVFPTRERGYEQKHPDAFDAAVLAGPPPPPLTQDQIWNLAAPLHPRATQRFAAPPPPEPPPPTLWSAPAADRFVPGAPRYLELLFDHADVCVVTGCVRYTPDHALRPTGPYQMKVICDPQGTVTILGPGELDLVRLATARWRSSALANREQDGREPDDFQWIALEDALRAELSRAP